jgi:hypothetical protein
VQYNAPPPKRALPPTTPDIYRRYRFGACKQSDTENISEHPIQAEEKVHAFLSLRLAERYRCED